MTDLAAEQPPCIGEGALGTAPAVLTRTTSVDLGDLGERLSHEPICSCNGGFAWCSQSKVDLTQWGTVSVIKLQTEIVRHGEAQAETVRVRDTVRDSEPKGELMRANERQ